MRLFGILVLFLSLSVPASAQRGPMPDEQVEQILNLALDNINRAHCGSGPCAPATAQEKSSPPISIQEARFVIERGIMSAGGRHCGLDWQNRNFVPMMAYWRKGQKDERQIALIVLVHGIMDGMANLGKGGPCSDQMRASVDARLNFQP